MKITIITQYFPPDTGGASTRSWNIANALRENGHTVSILTAFPHYPKGVIPSRYRGLPLSIETKEGFRVIRVRVPPLPHEGTVKRFVMYLAFSLSALPAVVLCGATDITWALSPNYLCMLPAVTQKIVTRSKVVQDVVDIWPDALRSTGYEFPSLLLRVVSMITRVSYIFSDTITTLSKSMRNTLQRTVPRTVDVRVLQNCVTPDFFRIPMGRRNGRLRVLYLGTLGPSNDFETVIEAATKLKNQNDVTFTIAGTGESLGKIEASIINNGLNNVHLHGHSIPHDTVPTWLQDADALILPLRSGFGDTSFPSKLGEYLASGRPAIILADGKLAEDVRSNGLALLVSPGDVGGLVEAISRLRQDDGLYNRLTKTGRSYAEGQLSFPSFDEKVESIIHSEADRPAHLESEGEGAD